jgi:predicted site-specific integrase-resolvase
MRHRREIETVDDGCPSIRWPLVGGQPYHRSVLDVSDAIEASGLSDRRAGLRKALSECMKRGVDRLFVEHPDRLARFGVGVIDHLLSGFGVEVIYTGQADDESAESELVRDMLAVVTSFAGRLYGQRSAKTKRLRAAVSAETECGDAA